MATGGSARAWQFLKRNGPYAEAQGLLVRDRGVPGYVAKKPLGRARIFPDDGDTAVGNEAPVLVPRPNPELSALSDGERNPALGAYPQHGVVPFDMTS